MTHVLDQAHGDRWSLYQGDSTLVLDGLPDHSVGHVVASPPFPALYAYTNTPHDLGNTRTLDELIEQFSHLVKPLQRVVMPGRIVAWHVMQIPSFKGRGGHGGIVDFRGRVVAMMEAAGWAFAGEATIDKNPQVEAVRTKEAGLLFKTLATDSSRLRMALPDYLLYFRAPGTNPVPIQAGIHPQYHPDGGWVTQEDWIEWASPVWRRHDLAACPRGIRQTDVLDVRAGRDADDERHLCPLQLEVIRRCVRLWSNPDEVILSPFAGIGSEGHVALEQGRRFVGVELKESYFRQAARNLAAVEDGVVSAGAQGQLAIAGGAA